jgi:hypothetical protein
MKRVSIVIWIVCAGFVSAARGQQPAGTCSNNWTEFHRPNMRRSNPVRRCLGSKMLRVSN